jgi:formamidopyrimidine-DNA glycosylase
MTRTIADAAATHHLENAQSLNFEAVHMPELPEVETVRRGLAPYLEGHVIERVTIDRHDLRRPIPFDLGQRLTQRRIERLDRRGKLMIWHLDSADAVLIHLGMSGRMAVSSTAPAQKHDHVRLGLDSGDHVVFNDPRRFGFFDLVSAEALVSDPLLSTMGPEPLGDMFTASYMLTALRGRTAPIKNILLDQHVVAGLGNIYVCESLFKAGIAPDRSGSTLSKAEIQRLISAIQAVLTRAITVGGSTLRDHRKPDGETGYFQIEFSVYDREGQPCPNHPTNPAHKILRTVQSGRSTYYCPGCQT